MYVHCNGVTLYYTLTRRESMPAEHELQAVVGNGGLCPSKHEMAESGPAILLVHGNGEDHTIFDETRKLLSKSFTVYALDSRGHGKSQPSSDLSYEVMAEDVAAFVRALNIKKPIYCGFSDGAIIGILAASRYPQMFGRLVLCGVNAFPEGLKSRWLKLFAVMERLHHDPKTLMMLKGPQIFQRELQNIQIPTLLLAGERDMIRESHTRFLSACIKNSSLKILPGETHGSYVVHSRKLYYHMKKFISADSGPTNVC